MVALPNRLRIQNIEVTSASDGTASEVGHSNGRVQEIRILEDSTDTPTDNWSFTVKNWDGQTIWDSGNITSDTMFYPKVQSHDASGSAISSYEPLPLKGEFTIDFSGMGSANKATLRFIYL